VIPRLPVGPRHGPGPASVVLCLLLVAASAVPVAFGHVPAVDRGVRWWTEAHQGRRVYAVLDAVTRVAYWPRVCVFLVVVAGIVAIARRTVQPLRQASLTVVLLLAVTWVLKAAAGRPGPTGVAPHPYDGAWPSGHALALVATTVVVLRLASPSRTVRPPWIAVAYLPAALVSVALVYCGHHWFTDVAVAFPLGVLVGWAAISMEQWWPPFTARPRPSSAPRDDHIHPVRSTARPRPGVQAPDPEAQ
jgi:membrane-associated phospholipid phosphatase